MDRNLKRANGDSVDIRRILVPVTDMITMMDEYMATDDAFQREVLLEVIMQNRSQLQQTVDAILAMHSCGGGAD